MTFEEVVLECVRTPELMAEYRRLTSSTLGAADERSPIARMVDDAAGHDPHDGEWEPFFRFVRDYVYAPLLLAA